MNLFAKIFNKETSKQKAIRLLKECAKKGDLQAEQMLSLYRSLEADCSCPIHNTIHALQNKKALENIVKSVKDIKKIQNKKKHRKRKNKTIKKNDK